MKRTVKQVITIGVTLSMVMASMGIEFNTKAATNIADTYKVPVASSTGTIGAIMPYTRYDSEKAELSGTAVFLESSDYGKMKVATQASNQSYVKLRAKGDYAQWKVTTDGSGVTMRYTMPDTSDGMGQSGSLDVYVNGTYDQTVNLTSYHMWQYFAGGNPSDVNDGGAPLFAFDEVHFKLNKSLKSGDIIRIVNNDSKNLQYGIDFIEVEKVPDKIEKPENAESVLDYGAIPNDGKDDYAAFRDCIYVANNLHKDVYIPEGTYHLSKTLTVKAENIKITGAGMWHTNLKFTSDQQYGGGISGNDCKNVEFCNMYIDSNLRSRYKENAVYKCFRDVFENCVFHDIWEDHFECGFWFGDYDQNTGYSDGTKIVNCRIRNNFADGVNFCQGTSNAAVYNCSVRNNGDDGLAMWNNDYYSKDEVGNIFAYNTIELGWRAGAIAVYGGDGHRIYNNYICDTAMSAGIHLNTVFSGYKFKNTKGIYFDNNTLIRTGCKEDAWKSKLAAIDLQGGVKNVIFTNNNIYDSQTDAVRNVENRGNIFKDTKIFSGGTGYTIPAYPAAGIFDPLRLDIKPTATISANKTDDSKGTTVSKNKLKTVVIKKVSKKGRKVKIKLKKISSVTGYQIQISRNKKFTKKIITKKVNKVSFVISSAKIKKCKKLYVRARVYQKNKGTMRTGKWSKTKVVK